MSQLQTENDDDNRSVAASDFVQFDQPDDVQDQQEAQQKRQGQQHEHFGLHQNALDWTMNTGGSTSNNCNDMKALKGMVANLEAKNQMLQVKVEKVELMAQGKMENLELKAEIRAQKENADQKANYQALETKFAKMLSTQNEKLQKGMTQLESKNLKLEEKLSAVELQTEGTPENGKDSNMTKKTMQKGGPIQLGWPNRLWPRLKSALDPFRPNLLHIFLLMVIAVLLYIHLQTLDGKMDQLKDEFLKRLSDQQTQMMAQFEAQNNSLEQKLKEAEQRAQMDKFEEIIHANGQKMEKLRKEMDENGKRLDYIWSQLIIKGKKLANPKGMVWNGSKTKASISEFGLKASTAIGSQYVFATEGFAISGKQCRKDHFPFPGTIVFYYEVTAYNWLASAGFSDGNDGDYDSTNSYAIHRIIGGNYDHYWISGKCHKFENSAKASSGDVMGSGLLLNSKNKWAVFFTLNGKLLVKHTPINPTVDRLYPTAYMYNAGSSVMANFGDNPGANPFKFDIDNFPGLVFE